ncbi:efflux RND transporter periplasmic adaptor subunit [Parapedobacter sp. ISTM3]|uniref:efflux RND transporter periplasmic adaptor subunit n=1 Tax=Parapedobacter sp. ISTM3 TaxID=2800130 RepID=UPI00190853DA|nr:efflux RND transporter periplasmic adaptor subunit [Parapedobacter sp. ISTM3]MBK1441916.1 efflux RND transporter periplasmic adaptor subunit [Parapedobacter sp. ISTM3]
MNRIFKLAGLCLLLWPIACAPKHEQQHEEASFLVTSPVLKDTLVTQEYVCQIHAIQHIELRALEKGYLQEIYVNEGQAIKKGQLMFKLNPAVYEAEVLQEEASMRHALIQYENTQKLADSNVVSARELALAKAEYEERKARYEVAKAHLGFTEIRAPFNGIMDKFYVRLGSLLDEGELLTSLSDNSKMWVYFNVPEAEYLDFAARSGRGKRQEVLLKMANHQLFNQKGIVEAIMADFNNENGNIAFRASFDNPQGLLRHGETGSILMAVPLRDALIIPQKATFEVLDRKYVYVIDQNNRVQAREIVVAQELPHLFVVASGLSEKDQILVEGLRRVKHNDQIHPRFEAPEKVFASLSELMAE